MRGDWQLQPAAGRYGLFFLSSERAGDSARNGAQTDQGGEAWRRLGAEPANLSWRRLPPGTVKPGWTGKALWPPFRRRASSLVAAMAAVLGHRAAPMAKSSACPPARRLASPPSCRASSRSQVSPSTSRHWPGAPARWSPPWSGGGISVLIWLIAFRSPRRYCLAARQPTAVVDALTAPA